ncbi:MAG: DNA repair protein RecO [Clostridia bacterium]|nr:DNA repair protein RecO [Clostridia bacterium]
MTLRTDGIIIREQTTGEQDRLVTVLTRDMGLIKAFVNGGRNPKNKNVSATDLLCYADYTIDKTKKDVYIIKEATAKQVFFNLRNDITNLSLAQYLAELARDFSPKEERCDEFLSLLLNSLHLLCTGTKSDLLIKTVTELRYCCIAGFMPSIVGCNSCGEYEKGSMYLNPKKGTLFCESCNTDTEGVKLTAGMLYALRHICFSTPDKIYSFSLGEDSLLALGAITERYVKSLTFKQYKTLDFYKTMRSI